MCAICRNKVESNHSNQTSENLHFHMFPWMEQPEWAASGFSNWYNLIIAHFLIQQIKIGFRYCFSKCSPNFHLQILFSFFFIRTAIGSSRYLKLLTLAVTLSIILCFIHSNDMPQASLSLSLFSFYFHSTNINTNFIFWFFFHFSLFRNCFLFVFWNDRITICDVFHCVVVHWDVVRWDGHHWYQHQLASIYHGIYWIVYWYQ